MHLHKIGIARRAGKWENLSVKPGHNLHETEQYIEITQPA